MAAVQSFRRPYKSQPPNNSCTFPHKHRQIIPPFATHHSRHQLPPPPPLANAPHPHPKKQARFPPAVNAIHPAAPFLSTKGAAYRSPGQASLSERRPGLSPHLRESKAITPPHAALTSSVHHPLRRTPAIVPRPTAPCTSITKPSFNINKEPPHSQPLRNLKSKIDGSSIVNPPAANNPATSSPPHHLPLSPSPPLPNHRKQLQTIANFPGQPKLPPRVS